MTTKIHSCLQFRLSGGPGNNLDPTMKLLDSHSKQRYRVKCLLAHSTSEYQDSLAGFHGAGKGEGVDWREAVQCPENERCV